MIITFKPDVDPKDWDRIHPDAKHVFEVLAFMADHINYECVITSLVRPKTTDTGIHATGRAIDVVWRRTDKSIVNMALNDYQKVVVAINTLFRRPSNFPAVIYHDAGSGFHFHIQVDAKNIYVPSEVPWVDLPSI